MRASSVILWRLWVGWLALLLWLGTAVPVQASNTREPTLARKLETISDPSLLRMLKVRMEYDLGQKFTAPIFCHVGLESCIRAYDELARLRWRGPGLAPSQGLGLELLQVDRRAHEYDPSSGSVIVAAGSSADEMLTLLNGVPWRPAQRGARWTLPVREPRTSLSQLIAGPSKALELLQEPQAVCAENGDYYERLFAEEQLRIGIYIGYLDLKYLAGDAKPRRKYEHHLGGLAQSMQRTLALALGAQGLRTVATTHGGRYQMFEGQLYHRGRPRRIEIELVNANVSCPGEVEVRPGIFHRGVMGEDICAEQRAISERSMALFTRSLHEHHLTIYLGHARGVVAGDGSMLSVKARGPSFVPFWQPHDQVAISAGALLDAPRLAFLEKILYLNSCSSYQHHVEDVNRWRIAQSSEGSSADITFIANRYRNALRFYPYATMALLLGIFEHKCASTIRRAMDDNFMIYRERRSWSPAGYALIDGALGDYHSRQHGHPRASARRRPIYITYEGRSAPPQRFVDLRQMHEGDVGFYELRPPLRPSWEAAAGGP